MTSTPGEQLEEEPQEERGSPGSRDEGTEQPGGGPADRPEGGMDTDTTVDPQSGTSADGSDPVSGEDS